MLDTPSEEKPKPISIMAVENVEPWDYYDSLRDVGPLVWDEKMDAWIVLSFDECAFIEINESKFRNPYQDAPPIVLEIKGGGRNITLLGGKEHMRMRRFFLSLLKPPLVEGYLKNQVAPIISMLVDRMLEKGTGKADLTEDFGNQIPPRVIAALLGMPWEDDEMIAKILSLHEDIMEVIGSGFKTQEMRDKGVRVSGEINQMLLPYVRARKTDLRDDLLSTLWREAPKIYGDDLTEADVVAISRELFLGGADTTVHGIANILMLILSDDKVRAAVEENRESELPIAVEESMRLFGSVMYRFRISNEDTVIAGTEVKKDQRLILLHSAANRDPAKYGCPHAPDMTRRPISDHLAFGKGPRACLGMGLARGEMRQAVAAILDRLPNVQLDPDAKQPEFDGLFMRSWRPLHVVFDK